MHDDARQHLRDVVGVRMSHLAWVGVNVLCDWLGASALLLWALVRLSLLHVERSDDGA